MVATSTASAPVPAPAPAPASATSTASASGPSGASLLNPDPSATVTSGSTSSTTTSSSSSTTSSSAGTVMATGSVNPNANSYSIVETQSTLDTNTDLDRFSEHLSKTFTQYSASALERTKLKQVVDAFLNICKTWGIKVLTARLGIHFPYKTSDGNQINNKEVRQREHTMFIVRKNNVSQVMQRLQSVVGDTKHETMQMMNVSLKDLKAQSYNNNNVGSVYLRCVFSTDKGSIDAVESQLVYSPSILLKTWKTFEQVDGAGKTADDDDQIVVIYDTKFSRCAELMKDLTTILKL